jgi:hypothetical protein
MHAQGVLVEVCSKQLGDYCQVEQWVQSLALMMKSRNWGPAAENLPIASVNDCFKDKDVTIFKIPDSPKL